MSALRDAIATWRALSDEDAARLMAYLREDTREMQRALPGMKEAWGVDDPAFQNEAGRVRVNEAALALLNAARQPRAS